MKCIFEGYVCSDGSLLLIIPSTELRGKDLYFPQAGVQPLLMTESDEDDEAPLYHIFRLWGS